MAPPLKPCSPELQKQIDEAFSDPWIAKKLNRTRRWKEAYEYLREHVPEFEKKRGFTFLDMGPGAGEFMEIIKGCGGDSFGIDAPLDSVAGMGKKYVEASHLIHKRQGLNVVNVPAWQWVLGIPATWRGTQDCINFRGSFAQICEHLMVGKHHETHRSELSCWTVGHSTRQQLGEFMSRLRDAIRPEGCILIAMNESKNQSQFNEMFREVLVDCHLANLYDKPLMWKIVRQEAAGG